MAGRSILITGASSGIGWDAAETLSRRGWRVVAACRRTRDVERVRGFGLDSVRIDYTEPASIADGLGEALEITGGRLDALFNNGAHGLPGAVEDVPTDALRAIFEANVFGWHDLTRRVVPVMRAQGEGRIVMNSSVLGFIAYPWRGAYVATKYALEGLTDTLRVEMSDTRIRVVLIQPGPIRTRIRENAIPHFERWIDWRQSARAAEYERTLIERLYGDPKKDRFELPPAAVTDALVRALTDRDPRPRYRVTTPTRIAMLLKRVLPDRTADWLLRRV